MLIRKVGNGPAKFVKDQRLPNPVPAQKSQETSKAGKVNPPTPAEGGPRGAVAPNIPAKAATKSFVPRPFIHSPPNPGPLPCPPTRNKLKTRRSVPALRDERPEGRLGGVLVTSKSNPALNKQFLEPQFGPDPTSVALASTASMNAPRFQSEQTPPHSSLLNSGLIQSPSVNISLAVTETLNTLSVEQKVEKQGFFSKLFRSGKSKPRDSKEHKSTKCFIKSTTSVGSVSTTFVSPTARPIPGPTTKWGSVATQDSTQLASTAASDISTEPTVVALSNVTTEPTLVDQRSPSASPQPVSRKSPLADPIFGVQQDTFSRSTSLHRHAVLVKKPPIVQPTEFSRKPSILTRLRRSPSHQNPSHVGYKTHPQTAHPQGTTALESLIPDITATIGATDSTVPSDNPASKDHEIGPASPADTIDQTYRHVYHTYGIDHIEPAASIGHTQHVVASGHHDQSASYTRGDYSPVQDSGYQSLATTPRYALCTVCNTNPQYIYPNTEKTSSYCSDACRVATTITTPQTQQATCSYPGCTHPAVMHPADYRGNYCSESHEYLARKGCIYCRQAGENGTQLCGGCEEVLKQHAPIIIPVPTDHDAFWHVVDKFTESWAHPAQCPVVQAVYKVVSAQHSLDTYLAYRDTLEYYGQFVAQGKLNGNERILWHGTCRACNLGETGRTIPCMLPKCSLCSIIRGSFDMGIFATNSSAWRFGPGIYTSTKSSKANDYSGNDEGIATPWKALLLNNVAAGHKRVTRYDDPTLTAPPKGYDSVYGEGGDGLNYDELVVYTNEAVRPTWLVMYRQR